MTEKDKKDVLNIFTEAFEIVSVRWEKRWEKKVEKIIKEAMNYQTDRFIAALKPYENLTEKHDKKFEKMKDVLKD